MCTVSRCEKNNEITYNYFTKIWNYNPPVNLWIIEGKAVEPLCCSGIYCCWYCDPRQLNNRGNSPLSVELLEESSNKCWEKLLICSAKFHQQSSVSWISWIIIRKLFKVKGKQNINTIDCFTCSVQNMRINFIFTLLQQRYLCQLCYCAVCISVSDCTTGVPRLQTVLFT